MSEHAYICSILAKMSCPQVGRAFCSSALERPLCWLQQSLSFPLLLSCHDLLATLLSLTLLTGCCFLHSPSIRKHFNRRQTWENCAVSTHVPSDLDSTLNIGLYLLSLSFLSSVSLIVYQPALFWNAFYRKWQTLTPFSLKHFSMYEHWSSVFVHAFNYFVVKFI